MVKPEIASLPSADPKGVLTGAHFIDGDHAICEGALAAGCRFVAGYPITPSTEVVERFSRRIPVVGGVFIQMEDELASSIAIQGAVWGGAKAMTVTSGPGFSLMQEHIGYAAMTECPCVFVNVQRAGPSAGLPTLPAQGDIMQARWGSHGDYEIIALAPASPQECFDMTIQAFNLAETWRVPVIVMADEVVGHMIEKVVIPPADEIPLVPRNYTARLPGEYLPYDVEPGKWVPEMARAGDGYGIHVTGLTHNRTGCPEITPETQEEMIGRLVNKIRLNAETIAMFDEIDIEGADCVIIAYGITSRISAKAMELARKEGVKTGLMRLRTVWPFPTKRVKEIAMETLGLVAPEINMGQVLVEVGHAALGGRAQVIGAPLAGGRVHTPEEILQAVRESVA